MPDKLIRRSSALLLGAVAVMLLIPGSNAEVLGDTVKVENGINKAATVSQKRITQLAQQTNDLLLK